MIKYLEIFIRKLLDFFTIKSPCCNTKMTSVFNMELDKMHYTCLKCKKEWI